MDYQQKYLKYKAKYNQLKENQNNQIGGLDFGELRAYFLTEDVFKMCIENQDVRQKNNKIMEDIQRKFTLHSKQKEIFKDKCKLKNTLDIIKEEVTEVEKEQFAKIDSIYKHDPLHGGFLESIKQWNEERKINKTVKQEAIDKNKCKYIIEKIDKLHTNINENISNLYNGLRKRCNFNMYGMNLYETLYGTEKLNFKLENKAHYCIQGRKELYGPKEKKSTINYVFDYLKNDVLSNILTKISDKDIKYMVVTRWYATSPEILICVYTVTKTSEKYEFGLIRSGKFYEKTQNMLKDESYA